MQQGVGTQVYVEGNLCELGGAAVESESQSEGVALVQAIRAGATLPITKVL